jgi:hypothetical protein
VRISVKHAHLNTDNKGAKLAIKPSVIGKKNEWFSNTAKGADISAILYSIFGISCKSDPTNAVRLCNEYPGANQLG